MNDRGTTSVSRLAALFALLLAVTACGGGGGGGTFYDGDDGDAPRLSIALLDPQGNATSTITASSPGTVQVRLRGKNVNNVLVSAQTTLGTILPSTGTALTDGNGVATFRLEAGPERGAGTISATATTSFGTATGSLDFQVGDRGLRLGYFDSDDLFIENQILIEPGSTLSAGGSAQLSVVILDSNGDRVTSAEEVRYTSGCIAAGQSTINPELPSSLNGRASTLYTAVGCSGNDNITASLVGAGAQAFGTVSISPPEANRVGFVSAEPQLIVLRGTGGQGRQETSNVVFEVVDGTGQPLAGTLVDFALTTYVGGLSLSKTSEISNGEGRVSVTVQSGDIPTVVRVIASVQGGNGNMVSTVSDLLTVTTGLPDQNSISLAVGECGGEDGFVVDGAMTVDGLCRTLTVSMADKFNNPVVDGTSAVFTTEYGSIFSACSTVGGTCSVEWRSQAPRFPTLTGDQFVVSHDNNQGLRCPSHNGSNAIPCPDDLGEIRGGRSTILVHAIGEESFIDRNGNGIMDEDERFLFQNMPEAFLDLNEDGVYTPALQQCRDNPTGSRQCISGQEEVFIDFNANGLYDLNDDPAVYNGLLCPVEGDGLWCSRELINVRAEAVVTLGDAPNFHFLVVRNRQALGSTLPVGVVLDLYIADTYNNPPSLGSSVSLSASGNCSVAEPTSTDVLNRSRSGAFDWGLLLTSEVRDPPEGGTVTITLDTPRVTVSRTYNCQTLVAVPDSCVDFSPTDENCEED